MTYRTKNIAIIVSTLFLVVLSYIPILTNTLVSDDYYFYSPPVTQNPFKFFLQDMVPAVPDAVFLRPLPILTFALESRFQKAFPILPHITNLLFHLMTTAVLGLLIIFPFRGEKTTVQSVFAPVSGMLIFALHPQATGAVDFVTARFDLMCGLFGIIGIYTWLNSVSKSNVQQWRLTALFAFALSLLSKETGIIFPAAIAFWELWRWLINRSSIKAKNQIVALSQLAALIIIYSVYRLSVLGGIGGYSIPEATGLYFNGPFGYILVMFWPFVKMGPVVSILLCSVLIIFIILTVVSASREKTNYDNYSKCPWSLALFVAVFPAMLLVPHLKFLNISQVLDHAEARLSYIPLLGFSAIMAWLLNKARDLKIGKVLVSAFLSLVLCFYVWAQQSEHTRWTKASRMVDSILGQTSALVPQPADNATLIFDGKILLVDRWYYVFGIGLPEAIRKHYGRPDLQVVRWPDKDILDNPPNNSYVLEFDWKSWNMVLAYPDNRRPKGFNDSQGR